MSNDNSKIGEVTHETVKQAREKLPDNENNWADRMVDKLLVLQREEIKLYNDLKAAPLDSDEYKEIQQAYMRKVEQLNNLKQEVAEQMTEET